MPQAFPYDPGDQLPTSGKALPEYKLLIASSLKSNVVSDQGKGGFALGFGRVVGVFVKNW